MNDPISKPFLDKLTKVGIRDGVLRYFVDRPIKDMNLPIVEEFIEEAISRREEEIAELKAMKHEVNLLQQPKKPGPETGPGEHTSNR